MLLLLSQVWHQVDLGVDTLRQGGPYTLASSRAEPVGLYWRGNAWVCAWHKGGSWTFEELPLPRGWAWLMGPGDTLWMVGNWGLTLKAYKGLGSSWDSTSTTLVDTGPKAATLVGETLVVAVAVAESQRVYLYKTSGSGWSVSEIPGPPGAYSSVDADADGSQLRLVLFSDSGLFWWDGNTWELVDSATPSPDYDGQTVRLSARGGKAFIAYSASGKVLIFGFRDTSWSFDTAGAMCLSCWYWSVILHSGGLEDLTSGPSYLTACHRDSWGSSGTCSGVGPFDDTRAQMAADSLGYLYVFAFTLGDSFRLYTTREMEGVEEGTGRARARWDGARLSLGNREPVWLSVWDASGRLTLKRLVMPGERLGLKGFKPGVYLASWRGGRLKFVVK